MKRAMLLLAVLFGVYGALVVLLPETSVSPGDLLRGHDALGDQCFACHRPFFGADRRRCTNCHEPARIGVTDSRGQPLRRPHPAPFHDDLQEPDCMRCHTEHRGFAAPIASGTFDHALLALDRRGDCGGCHERAVPADALHAAVPRECASCHEVKGWKPARFDHAVLSSAARERCVECHAKSRPADALHREAGDRCASCHEVKGWKPARFDHAALSSAAAERCVECHAESRPVDALHREAGDRCASCHEVKGWKPARFEHAVLSSAAGERCAECHAKSRPADALHRDAGSACGQCHRTSAWKPATFDHQRFFVFDRHHPSDCGTCHPRGYQAYTCYGCHEHSPARIASEHLEEGITRFEDCARCHRSGDAEEGERRGGRGEGRGRGHDGDDD